MSVQVVRVSGPQSVTPVRVTNPPSSGGQPVVVETGRPIKLDDLTDVDGATAAPAGSTLVKAEDGIYRGGTPDVVDWWSGDGPPPPVIPGASPGDLYFDRLGKGLYRLT